MTLGNLVCVDVSTALLVQPRNISPLICKLVFLHFKQELEIGELFK